MVWRMTLENRPESYTRKIYLGLTVMIALNLSDLLPRIFFGEDRLPPLSLRQISYPQREARWRSLRLAHSHPAAAGGANRKTPARESVPKLRPFQPDGTIPSTLRLLPQSVKVLPAERNLHALGAIEVRHRRALIVPHSIIRIAGKQC